MNMSNFTVKIYSRECTQGPVSTDDPSGIRYQTVSTYHAADYVEVVEHGLGSTVSAYTNSGAVVVRETVPMQQIHDGQMSPGQKVVNFAVIENMQGRTTQTVRPYNNL